MTIRLDITEAGIREAAALLRSGEVVAFPTETVYGLGADATSDMAVAKIYAAKDRPQFNPLIAHVADAAAAKALIDLPPALESLADKFWPGPLTLVARHQGQVSSLATAGLETLGVRVPDHPGARALLEAFGGPIVAPSANPSGKISPTTADHVIAGLKGRIAAVLDGGSAAVGLESTIVGWDGRQPVLLRRGGISEEVLAEVVGPLGEASDAITAPGQLASHYAPNASMRLNATDFDANEVMLGFGGIGGTMNLSPSGDLIEAATHLFAMLHELDATRRPIAVAPIPDIGLGRAINDRLRRAAAPR